jgi:hypothetical protein
MTALGKVEKGDYSLCMTCGTWGVYIDEKTTRQPTTVEAAKIGDDRVLRVIREAWEKAIAVEKKRPGSRGY